MLQRAALLALACKFVRPGRGDMPLEEVVSEVTPAGSQEATVAGILAAVAPAVGPVDLVVLADQGTVVMAAMEALVDLEVALEARLAAVVMDRPAEAKADGQVTTRTKKKEKEAVSPGGVPAEVRLVLTRLGVPAVVLRFGTETGLDHLQDSLGSIG